MAAFEPFLLGPLLGDVLLFGYFVGLPPAICTAIAYGLLVKRAAPDIPRPTLAALLGGFFSFLQGVVAFIPRGTMVLSSEMRTDELLVFATTTGGGVAAFVCTHLGRRGLYL